MKQRGIADLWALLGIVVAGASIIWGFKVWIADYNEGLREEGRNEIRLAVAKERNVKLLAAQAEIARLTKDKADAEAAHAEHVADIDAQHQREVKNAELQKERDLAAVRAGFRLRDPGQRLGAGCAGSGDGAATAVAGSAGGGDGKAGGELSESASGFLLGLAVEADEVVAQLTACQKIVEDDRK